MLCRLGRQGGQLHFQIGQRFAPTLDELLMRRMKKRKLQLKDRIAIIERLLEPDELA